MDGWRKARNALSRGCTQALSFTQVRGYRPFVRVCGSQRGVEKCVNGFAEPWTENETAKVRSCGGMSCALDLAENLGNRGWVLLRPRNLYVFAI